LLTWIARTIRLHMRAVFVAGNHEFYRGCLPDELARGRLAAAHLGVDFLEDEVIWIGDVAFSGPPAWARRSLRPRSPAPVAACTVMASRPT